MPVEFNDEQNQNKVLYGRFTQSNQAPKLVTWLLKIGIAKNETQANYFLIGIAIIAFVASFYIFSGGKEARQSPPPSMEQLQQFSPINDQ